MKKILALDGGGIRGFMTALILKDIENRLPNPDGVDLSVRNILVDHFDLFAGTSTGSILASAIATGKSLDRIIGLYTERGEVIFPSSVQRWGSRVMRSFTQGPSHPKYSDKALGNELKAEFGETRLGDVEKPLLIQTFDARMHEPLVFKSQNQKDERDADLPLWEVVKASSSAPTFLPAHPLAFRGGDRHAMIDGGVFANNPTLVALAETYFLHAGEDVLCVSLGTSEEEAKGLSIRRAREMGAVEWALPLIGIFMGGASQHVHNLAKRIMSREGEGRYLRFQIITKHDIPIDEASRRDIRKMERVVEEYLAGFPNDAERRAKHLEEGYEYQANLAQLLSQV